MYLDHFLCKMCHVFISNISLLIDFYIKTSTHLSACNKLEKLKTSGYPLYAKFDKECVEQETSQRVNTKR